MSRKSPLRYYLFRHVVNRLRVYEDVALYLELSPNGKCLLVYLQGLFSYMKKRFRRETRKSSRGEIEIVVAYELRPYRYKIKLEDRCDKY